MIKRNTLQKDLVLQAVQALRNHAAAEDVYAYVHERHPRISKGTVYRNLKILSEEGAIRHVEIPDGPDRFDHITEKHHHIRCVRCGRVFDADLSEIPAIEQLVANSHGFLLLDYDILLKGICPECQANRSGTQDGKENTHGSQGNV